MDVCGHLFPALNEALTDRLDDVFRAARAVPERPDTGAMVVLQTP